MPLIRDYSTLYGTVARSATSTLGLWTFPGPARKLLYRYFGRIPNLDVNAYFRPVKKGGTNALAQLETKVAADYATPKFPLSTGNTSYGVRSICNAFGSLSVQGEQGVSKNRLVRKNSAFHSTSSYQLRFRLPTRRLLSPVLSQLDEVTTDRDLYLFVAQSFRAFDQAVYAKARDGCSGDLERSPSCGPVYRHSDPNDPLPAEVSEALATVFDTTNSLELEPLEESADR